MTYLSSLDANELHRFHRVVTASTQVRSHFDLMSWLQGDLQAYLPHDVLLVSWGDFGSGDFHHDVMCRLPGVRSADADTRPLTPLMRQLHQRWTEFGRKPFSLNTGEGRFLLDDHTLQSAVGDAMKNMRSAIIHGVVDKRGRKDCLYVGFSAAGAYDAPQRSMVASVLPYIDTAMRQVALLPHQQRPRQIAMHERHAATPPAAADGTKDASNLTERESEVLHWVAHGKTNPEIAMILEISAFTVKNHMQKVFRKLDVSNRAQAVHKFRPSARHVRI